MPACAALPAALSLSDRESFVGKKSASEWLVRIPGTVGGQL